MDFENTDYIEGPLRRKAKTRRGETPATIGVLIIIALIFAAIW